jgi:DNA-directed RNA polymerase subunit RPC12/RpoP
VPPHTQYSSSTPYPQSPLNHDTLNHVFIPTPSEMAHSYQNFTPGSSSQMYPTQQPFHEPSVRPSPAHTSSHRLAPAHSMRTPQSSATTSPVSERYRCDKCGKTFSRSHDRKRHHETQHHPVPAIHRCRYCEKEFSRSDSLKRHLDNGCDEMR